MRLRLRQEERQALEKALGDPDFRQLLTLTSLPSDIGDELLSADGARAMVLMNLRMLLVTLSPPKGSQSGGVLHMLGERGVQTRAGVLPPASAALLARELFSAPQRAAMEELLSAARGAPDSVSDGFLWVLMNYRVLAPLFAESAGGSVCTKATVYARMKAANAKASCNGKTVYARNLGRKEKR